MKARITIALAALAAALCLPSCAGLSAVVKTPYGDVATENGNTTVELKPIVIEK